MVEGAALEKQYAGNGIEGSNPSSSAKLKIQASAWIFNLAALEDTNPKGSAHEERRTNRFLNLFVEHRKEDENTLVFSDIPPLPNVQEFTPNK